MKGGISHFTFKARYKTNNKLNPNPSRDLGIVSKVSIFASVWHLEPLECVCVFCVKSRLIKHIKVGASVFQEISLRYSYVSPVMFLSLSSESILFRRSPGKHFPESPWKFQMNPTLQPLHLGCRDLVLCVPASELPACGTGNKHSSEEALISTVIARTFEIRGWQCMLSSCLYPFRSGKIPSGSKCYHKTCVEAVTISFSVDQCILHCHFNKVKNTTNIWGQW